MDNVAQQNKNAYNYLAESYAKVWADKPDLELVEIFTKHLPPNATILDVGCGPGHYSLFFCRCGFDVVGIDFSENMISIATKLCDTAKFILQDMHNLCFESKSFDALWVCSSLVHIHQEEIPIVLSELKRVLKDDGIMFVNTIIGNKAYRLESEEEIGGTFKGNGRYFQWYPDSITFKNILNSAGFSADEICKKSITSQVVENASLRTNQWINYICKKM